LQQSKPQCNVYSLAHPVLAAWVFFYLERDMPEQTAKPIPTQLNIAPRGKTWKNWELVDGTDGFPTRESMEKYLCNPARVRDLEDCRVINFNTIDLQAATITKLESLLESIGAGGVESLRQKNQHMLVISEENRQLRARIAELESQLAAPLVGQQGVRNGWQLVPIEPTEGIEQAAADYLGECVKAHGLWLAMLAAAPQPPDADHIPDAGKMVVAQEQSNGQQT